MFEHYLLGAINNIHNCWIKWIGFLIGCLLFLFILGFPTESPSVPVIILRQIAYLNGFYNKPTLYG